MTKRPPPIPRSLHQIWVGSAPFPDKYDEIISSWGRICPSWSYRLWRNQDVDDLLTQYPELAELYEKLPTPVLKADMIRIVILWVHGGIYADLDMECVQPFDDLLEGQSMVVGREDPRSSSIGNAIVAATPNHPFMEYILDKWRKTLLDCVFRDGLGVVACTGPSMYTTEIRRWNATPGLEPWQHITIMDPEYFYPLPFQIDIVKFDNKIRNVPLSHAMTIAPLGYLAGHMLGKALTMQNRGGIERYLTPNSRTVHWWAGEWKGEIASYVGESVQRSFRRDNHAWRWAGVAIISLIGVIAAAVLSMYVWWKRG